mmetsp:Transcript_7749/g.17776  ORF Transcript_7749/g.17776 Transcript_7749/m.17776 type:complete len:254 (-) Transcript_7749:13-774(-)
MRIQILPLRSMTLTMVRRTTSICLLEIQASSSAWSANLPKCGLACLVSKPRNFHLVECRNGLMAGLWGFLWTMVLGMRRFLATEDSGAVRPIIPVQGPVAPANAKPAWVDAGSVAPRSALQATIPARALRAMFWLRLRLRTTAPARAATATAMAPAAPVPSPGCLAHARAAAAAACVALAGGFGCPRGGVRAKVRNGWVRARAARAMTAAPARRHGPGRPASGPPAISAARSPRLLGLRGNGRHWGVFGPQGL